MSVHSVQSSGIYWEQTNKYFAFANILPLTISIACTLLSIFKTLPPSILWLLPPSIFAVQMISCWVTLHSSIYCLSLSASLCSVFCSRHCQFWAYRANNSTFWKSFLNNHWQRYADKNIDNSKMSAFKEDSSKILKVPV